MERHIRESEVYLSTRELLYNVIAVYIITVLIKTSAELESHYNLLVVSCYLDHFFKFQVLPFETVYYHIACSYLHCSNCSKTWSVHCCLRYAIIIIIM